MSIIGFFRGFSYPFICGLPFFPSLDFRLYASTLAHGDEKNMPICAICGEETDIVTKCKQCGEKFCADCGSPEDKLCIYCLDDDEEESEEDEDWKEEDEDY